jgi:hypothetical protein
MNPTVQGARLPPKLDYLVGQQPNYDIVEDMINKQSSMTFGQVLNNVPGQRQNLNKAMRGSYNFSQQ